MQVTVCENEGENVAQLEVLRQCKRKILALSLATLCIFCFMNVWNDYFTPLIYINDARKYTLPLGLASMKGMYSTDWPVLMASSVIAVLPVLIAFLCAQDAFVKGVMMSGMKD